MPLKPAVGIALAALVAGCLDDNWTYRPYIPDAQLPEDVVADSAYKDVPQDEVVDVPHDVPTDTPTPDVPRTRTLTGAVGAAGVWQSTRYRIVGGFDQPARVCNANRTRCVTGGISP